MPRLSSTPIIQIDSVHCRAICEEVGYRLRHTLESDASEHPRHLALLAGLRRQERDDIGSYRGADRVPTPLRKRTG